MQENGYSGLRKYSKFPERQLISKVIDRATLLGDKNEIEFDYLMKVNYIDKSVEKYWFKLNSSKFKKGEETYLIRDLYTEKLNEFLLWLQEFK